MHEVSGVYTSPFVDTDDLKMALRARKVSGAFEKQAPDLKLLVSNTDFTVKEQLGFSRSDKTRQARARRCAGFFRCCFPFTSIPVELAIQVATDVLSKYDTVDDRTAIPVEDIVDLSDFCLSTRNF